MVKWGKINVFDIEQVEIGDCSDSNSLVGALKLNHVIRTMHRKCRDTPLAIEFV